MKKNFYHNHNYTVIQAHCTSVNQYTGTVKKCPILNFNWKDKNSCRDWQVTKRRLNSNEARRQTSNIISITDVIETVEYCEMFNMFLVFKVCIHLLQT